VVKYIKQGWVPSLIMNRDLMRSTYVCRRSWMRPCFLSILVQTWLIIATSNLDLYLLNCSVDLMNNDVAYHHGVSSWGKPYVEFCSVFTRIHSYCRVRQFMRQALCRVLSRPKSIGKLDYGSSFVPNLSSSFVLYWTWIHTVTNP